MVPSHSPIRERWVVSPPGIKVKPNKMATQPVETALAPGRCLALNSPNLHVQEWMVFAYDEFQSRCWFGDLPSAGSCRRLRQARYQPAYARFRQSFLSGEAAEYRQHCLHSG